MPSNLLKKDIMTILKKQIGGASGETRSTFKNDEVPKTFFGGADKPKEDKPKDKPVKIKKPPSKWILHVKKYAKDNNKSYKESMKLAKASYVKEIKAPKPKKEKVVKPKKEKVVKPKKEKVVKPKKEKVVKLKAGAIKAPVHKMPDGAIHTGKIHTKDSKVVTPAPEKKIKKKRPPTKWSMFLKQFRLDNKNLTGKNVMKEASKQYKSGGAITVPEIIEKPKEEIEKKAEIKIIEKPKEIKIETEIKKEEEPISSDINKSNKILADILDSYDNFNHEFETIANSDMTKIYKTSEFNRIMDRAFGYNERVVEKYRFELENVAYKRAEFAFDHLRESYEYGYKNLRDGADSLEFIDYEDENNLQDMVFEAFTVPPSKLDNAPELISQIKEEEEPTITDSVVLSSNKNVPEHLKIIIADKDDEEYECISENEEFYEEEPISKHSDNELVHINADTILELLNEKKDKDLQFNQKSTNYPYNVLTDENSIQATSIDNMNEKSPKMCACGGGVFSTKLKQKRPLKLRLYQEYVKLMKIANPQITKTEIDKIWKKNKNAFENMLMNTIELYGGDLYNDEHYFNVFSKTGGYMLMKGGKVKFDRSKYDKVNNPYGIGKTSSDNAKIAPKVIDPKLREAPVYIEPTQAIDAPLPRGNMSLLRGRDPTLDTEDNTDLSDPASWGRSISNIANMTFDTLKDVFDFFT